MEPIKKEELQQLIANFDEHEHRGSLYPIFLRMIKDGYLYESFIFILSTWNFACFRYAMRDFDFNQFQKNVNDLKPKFEAFSGKSFRDMNIMDQEKEIKYIFDELARIKGIQATGAPKLMHLACPKVFVMWDAYIRKYYKFKNGDSNDYLNFLEMMQKLFGHIEYDDESRTFAKAIDEYNYMKITVPALEKLKRQKMKK